MEEFAYDSTEHSVYFQGHRFFEDLTKTYKKIPKRRTENRKQAYLGSMMHFMRCLYNNKLKEEGFEVTRMIKQGHDYYINRSPLLTADSLITKSENDTRILFFKDYLSITYKNAKADYAYVKP